MGFFTELDKTILESYCKQDIKEDVTIDYDKVETMLTAIDDFASKLAGDIRSQKNFSQFPSELKTKLNRIHNTLQTVRDDANKAKKAVGYRKKV